MSGRVLLDRRRLALAGALAYTAAGFGYRTWVQYRRTGDSGWRGFDSTDPAQRTTKALIALGAAGLIAGPARALRQPAGADRTAGSLAGNLATASGSALLATGFVTTLVAQRDLGLSWRVGVDPQEHTELVTTGLFARVRNPIFSGMLAAAAGLALLSRDRVTAAAATALTAGIVTQTRLVEEPYLRRTHGRAYRDYEARTGRFVPRLGR